MDNSHTTEEIAALVQEKLELLRHAQIAWKRLSVQQRIKFLKPLREVIYAELSTLAQSYQHPLREEFSETIAAELMPLVSAIEYLESNAVKLLNSRTIGGRSTPMWLGKVQTNIHRIPWGVVLILGTWNYPIFLTGVQLLQSLIAGNVVLIKPGQGAEQITIIMKSWLTKAGFPEDIVQILPDAVAYGQTAIKQGVDKIVMTGSTASGRAVMQLASETLTPVAMELSGNDALIVLDDADLKLAVSSLKYGLLLNGGATCIAPRRVFIPVSLQSNFIDLLKSFLQDARVHKFNLPAWNKAINVVEATLNQGGKLLLGTLKKFSNVDDIPSAGASPLVLIDVSASAPVCQEDLFAPVVSIISYRDEYDLIQQEQQCPYALGLSIFGTADRANLLALKLRAGHICINDLIVPTADPRVPFGGTAHSGFGVTRGAEGLLEFTRPQVITTRKDKWRPHLEPVTPYTQLILTSIMKILCFDSLIIRIKAFWQLIRTDQLQRKWFKAHSAEDQTSS